MDLGIKGKRAIVCAASSGFARGTAEKLAEAGVILTLTAADARGPERIAADIRERYQADVRVVAADITTEEGRRILLEAEPAPDILVTGSGDPPGGMWFEWQEETWQRAIHAGMLTPIFLMTSVLPGMIERGWGRIVNITSASAKSPAARPGLSGPVYSGLTGFVAGTARQVARHGIAINNLLPGSHETLAAYSQNSFAEEARRRMLATNPTGRIGRMDEFGALAAFLCSEHCGFMIGQNLLVDGGAWSATLG